MGLGIGFVAPAMGAGDVEEARGSAPLCNHCGKRTAHEKHIWPRPPRAKRKILQVLPNERGYLRSRKRGNHVRSRHVESSQFRQEFGLLPEGAGAARLRSAVSGRGGKERGLRPEGSA